METQLNKKGVDYCAKLFPKYSRAELEKRIQLGEQVYREKMAEVGVEKPLSQDELGWYSVFQYYKLWTEATDEERAEIPDNVSLEEEPIDDEFEGMVERLEASGYELPEEEDAPDELH